MEFTNQEKLKEVKRILIERIEGADSFEAFKTLIGTVAWPKLIALLGQDLQAEADQCTTDSQDSLNRRAKLLALKTEKNSL